MNAKAATLEAIASSYSMAKAAVVRSESKMGKPETTKQTDLNHEVINDIL
ncbi:hypothetical protein [Prochlorococcus marinus]|nr:hypothetical protein [Prochlorococcus marinus]